MLHADGRVVWVRDRGRVLERDPAGRPRVLQGLAEDITDERQASESMLEAQDRYRIEQKHGEPAGRASRTPGLEAD